MLPPVEDGVRTALLSLADFKDIPTEQLKQTARQLPGGSRVHLPDRVTTILGASPVRLVPVYCVGDKLRGVLPIGFSSTDRKIAEQFFLKPCVTFKNMSFALIQ